MTIKLDKPVKWIFMGRRQFKARFGENLQAWHLGRRTTKQHYIILPYKSSTIVKLHELGHAVHGHCSVNPIFYKDLIVREFDAETFALKCMGKEVTAEALFRRVVELLVNDNFRLHPVFKFVKEYLEKRMTLSDTDVKKLWEYTRIIIECKKENENE